MEYLCLKCGSDRIGFIFENDSEGMFDARSLIREKKVTLSDSYGDYLANPEAPKWMCYDCRDCGVVKAN